MRLHGLRIALGLTSLVAASSAWAGYSSCVKEISRANSDLTKIVVIGACDDPGELSFDPPRLTFYDLSALPKFKVLEDKILPMPESFHVPAEPTEADVDKFQAVMKVELQKFLDSLSQQGFQKITLIPLKEDTSLDRRQIKGCRQERYEDQASFFWPDNKEKILQLEWSIQGGKISPVRLSLRDAAQKIKTLLAKKLPIEEFNWNYTAYSDPKIWMSPDHKLLFGVFGGTWSGIWALKAP